MFQYAITVELGHLFRETMGSVTVTIVSKDDIIKEELIPGNASLYPGLKFGKLMVRPNKIRSIRKVLFSWSSIGHNCSLKAIVLNNVKIGAIEVSKRPKTLTKRYCGHKFEIRSGVTLKLVLCSIKN